MPWYFAVLWLSLCVCVGWLLYSLKGRLKLIPLAGYLVGIFLAVTQNLWFIFTLIVISLLVLLFIWLMTKRKFVFAAISFVILLAAIYWGFELLTRFKHESSGLIQTPIATGPCTPAKNLNLTTSGEVIDNLDDGDSDMGTILLISRDSPSKDPVIFVIMPGSSVDVEYKGKMYFTTDHFNGSVEEGTCLANEIHKSVNTNNLIVVGSDTAPKGWTTIENSNGWWIASTWLYQADAIKPNGLTASEGKFLGKSQKDRTITTTLDQVVYGQFWQTAGTVVHIQIRGEKELSVPEGYQGTYWIWSGNFEIGETDLQKRMLQATFTEIVNRDDVEKVILYSCGELPSLDQTLFTLFGGINFGDVRWEPAPADWKCK